MILTGTARDKINESGTKECKDIEEEEEEEE